MTVHSTHDTQGTQYNDVTTAQPLTYWKPSPTNPCWRTHGTPFNGIDHGVHVHDKRPPVRKLTWNTTDDTLSEPLVLGTYRETFADRLVKGRQEERLVAQALSRAGFYVYLGSGVYPEQNTFDLPDITWNGLGIEVKGIKEPFTSLDDFPFKYAFNVEKAHVIDRHRNKPHLAIPRLAYVFVSIPTGYMLVTGYRPEEWEVSRGFYRARTSTLRPIENLVRHMNKLLLLLLQQQNACA